MNRLTRNTFVTLGVATLLAFADYPTTVNASAREPLLPAVALTPIVAESLPFENTVPRADQEAVLRKLSDEATKQAGRLLVRAHLAGNVSQIAPSPVPDVASNSSASEQSAATATPTVSGTLRLPVSLPARVLGWDASRHKGRFATVSLTIADSRTGVVLATAEGTCDWKDARWLRDAKSQSRVPLDDVLAHFARKTTERAVWNLVDQLRARRNMGAKQ